MKICIIGDEWACGEFSFINHKYYGVVHKGLEQYCKDAGIDVVNLAEKYTTNLHLYNKLKATDLSQFDNIFYFQVDPMREYNLDNAVTLFSKVDILKSSYKELLDQHYKRLNSLNTQIYLIGGSDKVHQDDLVPYTNLKLLIPSVMEFCIPTLEHPAIWPSGWEQLILMEKNQNYVDVLEYICKEKTKRDRLLNKNDSEIEKYFHPDGKQANRTAHLKIFEYIKENIFEK